MTDEQQAALARMNEVIREMEIKAAKIYLQADLIRPEADYLNARPSAFHMFREVMGNIRLAHAIREDFVRKFA